MIDTVNNTTQRFLSAYNDAGKSLIDFIELLQTKVETLSDMAEELRSILKKLAEILKFNGGFYFLRIPPGTGGVTYFIESLQNATGGPENSDYAAGVVVLYTDGGTADALKLLLGSFP